MHIQWLTARLLFTGRASGRFGPQAAAAAHLTLLLCRKRFHIDLGYLRTLKGSLMDKLAIAAQIVIALSVYFVWVLHFENVVKEFHEYHLSDLTRSAVGALKMSLSALLLVGIWYPSLVLIPALIMAFMMLSAQVFHARAHHTLIRYVPSLGLLLLSLFVAGVYRGVLHQ